MTHNIKITGNEYSSLPELVSVDMPCVVQNEKSVTDILGGKELFEKSIAANASSLNARFPGSSILRQPLIGTRNDCEGILLRVRRKKGDKTGSSMQTSVVGRVTSTYKFETPASYEFVVKAPAEAQSPAKKYQILETIPKAFPRIDAVSTPAYLFVDAPGHLRDRSGEQKKNKWVAGAYRIRVGEPVPQSPHPQVFLDTSSPDHAEIKAFLADAFSRRPCWFRRVLVDKCVAWLRARDVGRVTFSSVFTTVSNLLPTLSFTYSSGPWMGLWVKFGFDPQREVEGMCMQVVVLKMKAGVYKQAVSRILPYIGIDKKVVVNLDTGELQSQLLPAFQQQLLRPGLALVCFGSVFQRSFYVQICDIVDDEMVNWMSSLGLLVRPRAAPDTVLEKEPADTEPADTGNKSERKEAKEGTSNTAAITSVSMGWLSPAQYDTSRYVLNKILLKKINAFVEKCSEAQINGQPVGVSCGSDASIFEGAVAESGIDVNIDWYKKYVDACQHLLLVDEPLAPPVAAPRPLPKAIKKRKIQDPDNGSKQKEQSTKKSRKHSVRKVTDHPVVSGESPAIAGDGSESGDVPAQLQKAMLQVESFDLFGDGGEESEEEEEEEDAADSEDSDPDNEGGDFEFGDDDDDDEAIHVSSQFFI